MIQSLNIPGFSSKFTTQAGAKVSIVKSPFFFVLVDVTFFKFANKIQDNIIKNILFLK